MNETIKHEAREIEGVQLPPRGTDDKALILYTDQNSESHRVEMPLDEMLWMAWMIAGLVKEAGYGERLDAIVRARHPKGNQGGFSV